MKIERFRKFQTQNFYPANMGEKNHHIKNDFCMVVRAGDHIFMRGQTGFDLEGNFHGEGDVEKQTENACKCVIQLLNEAGGDVKDICKITVYLTDRSHRSTTYGIIAKYFKDVYPCSTGLIVNGLALPEMLVEIDVEAVITSK